MQVFDACLSFLHVMTLSLERERVKERKTLYQKIDKMKGDIVSQYVPKTIQFYSFICKIDTSIDSGMVVATKSFLE